VHLTQLKLAGFKSFAEPTIIPTPSHLVGVVGPNGCGKSNIIDAVRWVMGESRASELRGESMQDVIFNGSGTRKPAARASVELVFDNATGRAAGQWSAYSEISVRRVLTRDGSSSYFINNQSVRRRDVHDIFLGTGLGARGYAIIGQGMINRLIEARPEELRVYLEEAAGVSRYKERRRETENRLRDTRDNLMRVDDILRELDGQLERLESQARVARQYRELQQEGEQKQCLLWLLRENQARQDQQDRFLAIEQTQTQMEGALAALRAEEAALESRRQAHYDAAEAVHDIQGQLFEAGTLVSRFEAEIRHVTDARQRVHLRQQQLEQQSEQWHEQQEHCAGQIAETELELETAIAQGEEIVVRLDQARDDLPDIESRVRQAADQREELRRQVARIEQDLALVWQSRGDTDRQLQAVQNRQARLEHELRDVHRPDDAALERMDSDRKALDAQLDGARRIVLEFEQQLPELERVRRSRSEAVLLAEQDVAGHQARLDALGELQNDIQKKGSLQPWLAHHGLADLPRLWHKLQIQPGWETALEAILHERMTAIEASDLQQVTTFARDAPPGRLTFYQIPAGALGDAETLPGTPLLLSLLDTREAGLYVLLADWLRGVYACASVEQAMGLRDQLREGHLCVVPEGHVIDRHSVRFYAPDSEQSGLLARQQEIENERHDLKARQILARNEQGALEQAEAACARVASSLVPARTRVAELTEHVHQVQLELSHLRQLSRQADENTDRLRNDLAESAQQKEDLLAIQDDLLARFDTLDEQLAEHQEHFGQACQSGESLFEIVESKRQTVRDLENQRQAADYAERTLKTRITELTRTLQLAADQAQQAVAELSSLQGELFDLDESSTLAALQEALEKRLDCEQRLERARIEYDNLSASLRTDDERRLLLERSLEPLRARITDLQLKEQAARLAIEQFSELLDANGANRATLQQVLDQAPAEWHKPAWLQSEVQRLSRQLDSLGAVNLAALDELHTARERQEFLTAQYDDLVLAIQTLEDAIRKIDRETRELLQTTFDSVNGHFGELFPQLFGGGEARLTMTGDEILDAGVLIMAQPPGKRNSTIHLLSGGEKALTAIALVFALFKLNPAPFCLLDEVDAPLDDANTERYAKLVSAMSSQTQFLFVSHNKIAMQMARQLVGVTMQEQGVSRIVAVDMESALEMAQA